MGFVERGTTEQELADHFKVDSKPLFYFWCFEVFVYISHNQVCRNLVRLSD